MKQTRSNGAYRLEEIPPGKDENGEECRADCFRHEPTLVKQYKEWKANPTKNHKIISLNKVGKSKKTRTVIYINSAIGYGELAALMKMNENV